MDKAESSYEAMCLVAELKEEEFISSDAMSKLRQVSSWKIIAFHDSGVSLSWQYCCSWNTYMKYGR